MCVRYISAMEQPLYEFASLRNYRAKSSVVPDTYVIDDPVPGNSVRRSYTSLADAATSTA